MKTQKNIFIEDLGNRPQAIGLPNHYSKLGHNVYMLKPNEFLCDWNWEKIPIWPRLLHKEGIGSNTRNLSNFSNIEVKFGEDSFIENERDEILQTSYDCNAHVTLITEQDLKTLGKDIDIFHTTEFCISVLDHRLAWARKYLPNAAWISSCFNPSHVNTGHPGNFDPDNVCIIMPSPCEFMFPNKNRFHMFRHDFEFDLLGVKKNNVIRSKNLISSFMHNFHVRDPEYYKIFLIAQEILKKNDIYLTNYGGNIRGVGADIRYSLGGPSGSNFETLSCRKAVLKYYESRAILHLKGLDWGGGVPAHSQISGTPFITIQQFLLGSNYCKYYNNNYGTVTCNSIEEIVNVIFNIVQDDNIFNKLSKDILSMSSIMFDNDYWNRFDSFVERAAIK